MCIYLLLAYGSLVHVIYNGWTPPPPLQKAPSVGKGFYTDLLLAVLGRAKLCQCLGEHEPWSGETQLLPLTAQVGGGSLSGQMMEGNPCSLKGGVACFSSHTGYSLQLSLERAALVH